MSNMENPDDGGASLSPLLGGAGQPLGASAKVGISADSKAVTKLRNEFSSLHKVLKDIRSEMEAISKASQGIRSPGSTATIAGTGASGTPMAGAPFRAADIDEGQTVSATRGGGGGGVPQSLLGKTAMAGTQLLSAGIQIMDQRIDRSRDYALSADRMSLVYQQMYGLSQNQVANQYRTPMTNFKLGAGGINELMAMQATTGISALQQAGSVESLRAMSGFSLSTGQITNMMSQLAAPDVANRMFMLGGTGLIGPGGQQRDMIQVMQDITRSAGLTDPRLAKSALAPGSITRANLSMMGVTGEMQDMVIQYAQQNLTYKQKGGRGMYDPKSKEAQKIMGIEDNFAMQAEETDRLRVKREEQFYKHQADNFSDLEKQTQTLTKAMAALEDTLSDVIGRGISTKGARQIGSMAGTIIGGAIGSAIPGVGTVGGALLGGIAGQLVGGFISGDPSEGQKSVPFGYGDQKVTISDLQSKSTYSKLHPTFRGRLEKMMADNPAVGVGGGYRSPEEQERMFRSRYTPTSEKTDTFWNGQYWKHTSGAPAAPPGKSMHEIGLAADLVGDLDWVQKNAAKYGLKTFNHLGEPWHIQPAELPGSRSEYEKSGAPWGTMDQPMQAQEIKTPVVGEDQGIAPSSGKASSIGAMVSSLGGQLSIEDKINATRAFVYGNRAPSKGAGGTKTNSPSGSTTSGSTNTSPALGGGAMSGEAVAKLLYAAGFRGKDLADALAISWRESRWNPGAFANDEDDLSYGLFQHNMIPGATNPEGNRRDWGIGSNDALFDPATNVRIAYEKYKWNKSHNKHPFDGWFTNGSHLSGTDKIYSEATRIARQVEGSGDPVSGSPSSTGGTVSQSTTVSGNHTFHISPNITINGSASNTDLQQMAKAVARMLEREIRSNNLRSF